VRVIGFDPGLRRTGWGVVDWRGGRLGHVANGACTTAGGGLAERLAALHAQIDAVIAAQSPDAAAVELTFVSKDAVATLKLGQARAIALLVPAQRGLAVAEYAPNAVKKAVVGVGHADKRQIQHMVARLLPGVRLNGPDAADALAVAICHAWAAGAGGRLEAAVGAAMGRSARHLAGAAGGRGGGAAG
jgi:crossover junction endodeoxyribonuclease RuvC